MKDLASARVANDLDALPIDLPDSGLHLDALIDHLNIAKRSDRTRGKAVDNLRSRMEEFEIDPDLTVDGLLELLEDFGLGVDLWTSPKRNPAQKYRCVLYLLHYGSLQRFILTEAPTAWAALAAAIVSGFERGRLEWE
jgi:hypothetical protein